MLLELINSINKLEKIIILIVFTLIIVGLVWSRVDINSFEGFYVREDGPVEWLQFTALFVSALLTYQRIYLLKKVRSPFFLLCLLILAGMFTFGAGEEISWGQRILEIQSPEFFVSHNSQQETNFHNLILGGVKINRLVFGTLLGIAVVFYTLVLPFLYRKSIEVKKWSDRFAIPIPKMIYIPLYLLVFAFTRMIPSGKKGEILELGGTWLFLLMTYYAANKEIYDPSHKL